MPTLGDNLRINPDRLWDAIHEIAEIGPGIAGGSNRQTLTDDDKKGRELFKGWCDAAGMTMGVDQMGTMFARREGTDPNALPVYSARTSIRSRPVGAMTACSGCWVHLRSCGHSMIWGSRPGIRSS